MHKCSKSGKAATYFGAYANIVELTTPRSTPRKLNRKIRTIYHGKYSKKVSILHIFRVYIFLIEKSLWDKTPNYAKNDTKRVSVKKLWI